MNEALLGESSPVVSPVAPVPPATPSCAAASPRRSWRDAAARSSRPAFRAQGIQPGRRYQLDQAVALVLATGQAQQAIAFSTRRLRPRVLRLIPRLRRVREMLGWSSAGGAAAGNAPP